MDAHPILAVEANHAWRVDTKMTTQVSDKLREALAETVKALKAMASFYGAAHDSDCSMDDTCECSLKPFNDLVNGAVRNGDAALAGPCEVGRALTAEELADVIALHWLDKDIRGNQICACGWKRRELNDIELQSVNGIGYNYQDFNPEVFHHDHVGVALERALGTTSKEGPK